MSKPTAVVVGVGAEHGLGAALCRRFAAEGHHVLAAGRTEQKIAKVVAAIAALGGSAEGLLATDATAEADGQIHRQPRSAWTHEIDLRPFKEPF
jgi:NAD(P)-dependent dehydrogenase (short-subunit alcohol dehydrogenase family)